MRRGARVGSLTLVLLLLAACGGGGGAPPADTGLILQTLVGPACPVIPQDEPCPDRPRAAQFRIVDQRGQVAVEGETDERGWAAVPLPPGTYQIEPLDASPEASPEAPPMPPRPVEFRVESGVWTEVTVLYDSGIR